nr:MAG TPA: Rifin [Bacteriophage sp.]
MEHDILFGFVIVSIVALLSIIPLILRHSNMYHGSQVN